MTTSPVLAISRRIRSTPFTSRVIDHGAKAFTTYNHMLLPVEFESLEYDYWHLCEHVQVWDVGAERQVSISGRDADRLVQWMTPRDISDVEIGRCVYLPLADEEGKLINDPIGLKMGDHHWWLSVADSDVLLWAKGLAIGADMSVAVTEPDVWPLAVQGPKADELMERVFGPSVKDIRFFRFAHLAYKSYSFVVARSGWSKQGGFEIYVDHGRVGQQLYDELFEAGQDLNVRPGAPNLIERMESSLLSYGNDMDSRHSPLESGLEHFIHLDRDLPSMSHPALRKERSEGSAMRLSGLVLKAPSGAMPLCEYPIDDDERFFVGSQVWSPKYQHQLATIMLDAQTDIGEEISVSLLNGESAMARICALPFDFPCLSIKPQARVA